MESALHQDKYQTVPQLLFTCLAWHRIAWPEPSPRRNLRACEATRDSNDSAIRAVNLRILEDAVAVELMVPLQAQANSAAALEGERSIVSIDEEVDSARVGSAVDDLGEAAAGVGGTVGPDEVSSVSN